MAILGTIALLASIVTFAQLTESLGLVALYCIGIGVSLFFLIRWTLRRIPRAKPGYSIYLNKDQEGFKASSIDLSAVGKRGVVVSDLKPAGYIMIEGKKQQAISTGGYIPKGTEVVVIRGEEESLIVKPIKKDGTA